jgi:hypothetical protein
MRRNSVAEYETHNLDVGSSILPAAPNFQALTSMAEDAIDNRAMVVRLPQGLYNYTPQYPNWQRSAAQTRADERSTRSWGIRQSASVLQSGRETRLRAATVRVQVAPGAYITPSYPNPVEGMRSDRIQ